MKIKNKTGQEQIENQGWFSTNHKYAVIIKINWQMGKSL